MKHLMLICTLITTSFIAVNAQTSKPTTEQKLTLNPIVDDGFFQWSKSWSYDRYVGRSAKITSIKIDEDYGDFEVDGDFDYKRFGTIFSGTFTAKINNAGKLVNIKYIDAGGIRGSKNF
jgi:hypothetical protein